MLGKLQEPTRGLLRSEIIAPHPRRFLRTQTESGDSQQLNAPPAWLLTRSVASVILGDALENFVIRIGQRTHDKHHSFFSTANHRALTPRPNTRSSLGGPCSANHTIHMAARGMLYMASSRPRLVVAALSSIFRQPSSLDNREFSRPHR